MVAWCRRATNLYRDRRRSGSMSLNDVTKPQCARERMWRLMSLHDIYGPIQLSLNLYTCVVHVSLDHVRFDLCHAILFILAWSKDTVQPMVMLFCVYLLDQRTQSNLLTHCLLGISNVIWIFRSDHIRVHLQCCCHLVKYTSLLIIWQHWFRPWLGTIRQQATPGPVFATDLYQ